LLTRTFPRCSISPTHLCLRRLRHGTPPGSRPLPTSCLCAIFRREPCNAGLVVGGGDEDSQFRWTTPLSSLASLSLCLFPPAQTHPTSPHSSAHLRLAGLAPVRYCLVLLLCVLISPVRATSPITHSPTHPRPRPPAHRRLPASCLLPVAAAAVGLVAAASARRPQTLPVLSPLAHARGCAWVPRHHTQMLRSASAAQLGPARLSSPPPLLPPSLLLAFHSSACLPLLPSPPPRPPPFPLHRCHCASPPSHVIPTQHHHDGLGKPKSGTSTVRCRRCYVAHRPCQRAEAQEKPEHFFRECDAHRFSPARCESTQDF
jgi:hypothetical protein